MNCRRASADGKGRVNQTGFSRKSLQSKFLTASAKAFLRIDSLNDSAKADKSI
jgi:hypothetical protein